MSIKKINYDQFSENLESILDEVIDDRGVVIVGRADQGDITEISASELSAIEETLHLLKSPANAQKLFAAMERANKLEAISDDEYLRSIDGMVESIQKARNEPIESCVPLGELEW